MFEVLGGNSTTFELDQLAVDLQTERIHRFDGFFVSLHFFAQVAAQLFQLFEFFIRGGNALELVKTQYSWSAAAASISSLV